MPLYVLDTNVIRLLARAESQLAIRVRAHPPEELRLSAITLRESLAGWYTNIAKAKTADQIQLAYGSLIDTVRQLGKFDVLNFDCLAIARFETLLRMKLNVRGDDLRIAAICLENNATVVTANVRDFSRVPGLKIEDWTV